MFYGQGGYWILLNPPWRTVHLISAWEICHRWFSTFWVRAKDLSLSHVPLILLHTWREKDFYKIFILRVSFREVYFKNIDLALHPFTQLQQETLLYARISYVNIASKSYVNVAHCNNLLAQRIAHCGRYLSLRWTLKCVARVSISQARCHCDFAVLFKRYSSKNDTDAVDCCWSLLARSTSRMPALMELFYQGSTLHDGRYFIFARTSRGRHISEAASGKERQDEMEYQPMGSSRATGVTKRRKTRFCSRVEERRIGIREGERGSDGWRETRKGLLGLFARRWDGDGFAWSGLARMHAPIARSQFAGECRIMNFFDKHAIQSSLVFASWRYMQNFLNFDENVRIF